MRLNIFLPIFLMAVLSACSSQVAYNITGTAETDGNAIYLVDQMTGETLDSAIVSGGTFSLAGKADKNALLYVAEEDSGWMTMLFNDGTPITVNMADTTLTGSPLNEKVLSLDKELTSIYADIMRLFDKSQLADNDDDKAAFGEQMGQKYEAYTALLKKILEENSDNLVPVAFISQIMDEVEDVPFDANLPYAKHPYVVQLKQLMDEQKARMEAAEQEKQKFIGQVFTDLEEPDAAGTPHKLSEYLGKGKWVLVDFWASWCGPCKAEMPNVVAAYKKYQAKGFEIVGLSFDSDAEAWKNAIKEWEMPWIHLSDLKGWQSVASGVYSVNAIPDNILVDPEGKIVARSLRGEALDAKLMEIFK